MKNWVKQLISNAGLLVLIAGVIHLGYTVYTGIQTNGTLVVSTILVFGGLILYIVLNKLIK